jgi:hypothetical protein
MMDYSVVLEDKAGVFSGAVDIVADSEVAKVFWVDTNQPMKYPRVLAVQGLENGVRVELAGQDADSEVMARIEFLSEGEWQAVAEGSRYGVMVAVYRVARERVRLEGVVLRRG